MQQLFEKGIVRKVAKYWPGGMAVGPLHWLVLAGVVLAVALVLVYLLARPAPPAVSYRVQRFFISGQKRKLWTALQKAVGNEFMVLASVPLATLIQVEGEDSPRTAAWLQRRWVDFAVLEEKLLKPVAVVQIEGPAGEQPGKEPALQKALAEARLPLLWLPSEHYQHVELLRHALEQMLAPARQKTVQ